jgi:hypothetical protein
MNYELKKVTMDKQSKTKQLRDFIRSHEMRYFVEQYTYRNQVYIKKAFKVEINNQVYWIYFSYGDQPEIKDERILLKTMDEAKAKAQKLRDEIKRKKAEAAAKRKAMLEDVTNFLNELNWYNFHKWNSEEIKPEWQPFAEAIRRVYAQMPRREKDDEQTYIELLENYIKHGTIYTQAKSFRKEHVVSVRYGEQGAVEIELVNGTTITPKSNAVSNLIKTIFGDRLDSWSYPYVQEPTDKFDKTESPKR